MFEIDGDTHFSDAGIAADRVRTQYLESRGYRVFRFTNHDVMTSGDGVYTLVSGILNEVGDTPT